ncbi:GTP-binding nuclear protein Ran-like [Papaver somniferum]|nr:GTP-binding nuclear protein Ran-like [Papaver somniferum]
MESRILIIGSRKTGKTTLPDSVNAHLHENSDDYTVDFQTREDGNLRFICRETSDPKFVNYWNFDGFVVIFDLTNMSSYKDARRIRRELTSMVVKPIVLVANKNDLPTTVHGITADREFKVSLFFISAKKNRDVQKPFRSLARSIIRKPSLMFNAIAADEDVNAADEETDIATPDAADSILSTPTSPANTVNSILSTPTATANTPTNNARDLIGSSLSAGVPESTPKKLARRRRGTEN